MHDVILKHDSFLAPLLAIHMGAFSVENNSFWVVL
jgi:hypothetical protein